MKHILSILFLAIVLGATTVVSAYAQKTPQKKDAAQTAQQKKESSPNAIKDVLSQYVGKVTNLGTLKRITGDYFVLEEDGNTVMHPLSTIHTLKLVKDDEGGEMKLEIRLVAKD